MKIKNIVLVVLSSVFFAFGAAAQEPAKTPTKNAAYDAALAKRLGADQRGMKVYVMAILKSGPNYATIKGKERDDIFKGHFANIGRMAKEGTLMVAGPFSDPASDWAGLYIFNVKTIDEAKKLTETDPTLKSGVFVAEYHLWYGSAALMEITRIHGTLTENTQ